MREDCQRGAGKEVGMLELAITALLISIVAGALGFTGIARGAASKPGMSCG